MILGILISLLLLNSYAVARENSEKHIVIVTCSFNNNRFYKWNLDSICNQIYTNWHLIYVDDNSLDGTDQLVREYIRAHNLGDKVLYIHNEDRQLAMANLYRAIHMCQTTDVIAILDGDDRFTHDHVLRRVNHAYADSNTWLTYGQFRVYEKIHFSCDPYPQYVIDQGDDNNPPHFQTLYGGLFHKMYAESLIRMHGGPLFCCSPYPQSVIDQGSFRSHRESPSHLRTFYGGLFHKIYVDDLKHNGQFFAMTYDLAMMFPMVEMARAHIMFIPDTLVDYNNTNPINDHKVNKRLQQSIDLIIRGRPCYSEIQNPF